jgi:hypothetical protein
MKESFTIKTKVKEVHTYRVFTGYVLLEGDGFTVELKSEARAFRGLDIGDEVIVRITKQNLEQKEV